MKPDIVRPAAGGLALVIRLSFAGHKGYVHVSSERGYIRCLQCDCIVEIFMLHVM
jgi:hypothetical protein